VKTIVLGLGNTILRDDGVGVYAARALREILAEEADVLEAELAGLDIIEKLEGYERAIIIDAIQLEGEDPGTVFRLRPDHMKTTPRLASFHDVDLVTAIELGRRLSLDMPEDVVIYAVQVEDASTIMEGCVPAVEEVIPALVEEIAGLVRGRKAVRVSRPLSERRGGGA
jgi:hydrogenase maturation protease